MEKTPAIRPLLGTVHQYSLPSPGTVPEMMHSNTSNVSCCSSKSTSSNSSKLICPGISSNSLQSLIVTKVLQTMHTYSLTQVLSKISTQALSTINVKKMWLRRLCGVDYFCLEMTRWVFRTNYLGLRLLQMKIKHTCTRVYVPRFLGNLCFLQIHCNAVQCFLGMQWCGLGLRVWGLYSVSYPTHTGTGTKLPSSPTIPHPIPLFVGVYCVSSHTRS